MAVWSPMILGMISVRRLLSVVSSWSCAAMVSSFPSTLAFMKDESDLRNCSHASSMSFASI